MQCLEHEWTKISPSRPQVKTLFHRTERQRDEINAFIKYVRIRTQFDFAFSARFWGLKEMDTASSTHFRQPNAIIPTDFTHRTCQT